MNDLYVVDLESNTLEVRSYPADMAKQDMSYYGLSRWQDLSDFDWRVFESEREAATWLSNYKAVDLSRLKRRPELPCMLLKRRYMRQTILGEKLYTCRDYKKNWQKGQLFQFHDQVYFLTVRLKSIKVIDDGFRYDFELV